jgi:hypothetical protein
LENHQAVVHQQNLLLSQQQVLLTQSLLAVGVLEALSVVIILDCKVRLLYLLPSHLSVGAAARRWLQPFLQMVEVGAVKVMELVRVSEPLIKVLTAVVAWQERGITPVEAAEVQAVLVEIQTTAT